MKLARRYAYNKGRHGHLLSLHHYLHGRTLGTIALGKEQYQEGFAPLPDGFRKTPYNHVGLLEENVNEETIAILLEPVQGEGGVIEATPEFVAKARELCDKYDIPLIFDEVQTGIGRTGKMFAYQHFGVKPDIIGLAKGLGSGLPIGAVLAKEHFASAFSHGSHGTTFGGNPLACAAALATLPLTDKDGSCEKGRARSTAIRTRLNDLSTEWDAIRQVRGKGLMI